MKLIFSVIIIFLSLVTSFGQEMIKGNMINCSQLCDYKQEVGNCQDFILKLENINSITLGDTGEAENPLEYIIRFEEIVDYLDTSYTPVELIQIIKHNYCPLISSYALVCLSKNKKITDSLAYDLIASFAEESNSYIHLDYGCGYYPVETFDYMIKLFTNKGMIGYFSEITPLPKEYIIKLLELRKPFFNREDNSALSWEKYKEYYLSTN